MAGFVKVFSSITDSSIWMKGHEVIRVWLYFLAKCDSDGVLEGSIPGVAHSCLLDRAQMEAVLAILMAPDPDSRTPDHEGRRVEAVPGGWRVLNYHLYRDRGQGKEGSRAPYMRQRRATKHAAPPSGCNALHPPVTRHTEADANAAANAEVPQPPTVSGAAAAASPVALPMAKGLWTPPAEPLLRWKGDWPGPAWEAELGKIVDERDQVRTIRFSFAAFIVSMRCMSFASTNGPFLSERPTSGPPRGVRHENGE